MAEMHEEWSWSDSDGEGSERPFDAAEAEARDAPLDDAPGGGWLTVASSTRVVDLQRSAEIRFETSSVLGRETVIACGVARKSKARSKMQMKPLPWRAALIPIGGGEVDRTE